MLCGFKTCVVWVQDLCCVSEEDVCCVGSRRVLCEWRGCAHNTPIGVTWAVPRVLGGQDVQVTFSE